MTTTRRQVSRAVLSFGLLWLLVLPSVVLAGGVEAKFDLSSPAGGPFPSDRFTVDDRSQLTGLRVSLPKPSCAARPSDCADIDVLNTLDGFNLQPRLSIPFTGAIDPTSVDSSNVFLVRLRGEHRGKHRDRQVIGINQIVWEPATNTLHVESDELLDQHTSYALVVTRDVRDAAGHRLDDGDFARFRHRLNHGHGSLKSYRKALLEALKELDVRESDIAAMSVFTTQSVTAVLEKIRDQIQEEVPAPAVMHGNFPLATVTSIGWMRQVGTAPVFAPLAVPISLLGPLSVRAIAFGQYESPDYETALKLIPPIGTRTGVPTVQAINTLQFTLILPTAPIPVDGYPVVIFGHGFTDSKQGAPVAVATILAGAGLASISINVVGHGGGGLGTLTVNRTDGPPVIIPDGGRGIDQNGNGAIDSTEGVNAVAPLIGSRDGLRQTVVDIMQLVRVIQTGGIPGLSPRRIYYAGQSFGGIYGTMLLGVEPDIRAGVPNVPGGPIIETARLSPVFRPLVTASLAARVPSLLNGGFLGFTENIPLRNQPVLTDTVAGASAIQKVIDDTEWVTQSGNPVAYAPYIRKSPLHGEGTPVLYQFAKGDRTVPNPTTTALLRAGDLADRATYFRNDLWRPASNPHTFLTFGVGPEPGILAQAQMAVFLASDGVATVDPDDLAPLLELPPFELPPFEVPLFEAPIAGPLPEVLNFP